MQSLTPAQIEELTTGVRQLRDTFVAIAQAGPETPPQAIRSISALAARRADDLLEGLKP